MAAGKKPKRIGVNALYLIPGRVGGTEIYLRGLCRLLAQSIPNNRCCSSTIKLYAWLRHCLCLQVS